MARKAISQVVELRIRAHSLEVEKGLLEHEQEGYVSTAPQRSVESQPGIENQVAFSGGWET